MPNNIAEGHARRSDKAFRNFLFIAKGSAAEVESMLIIAEKLGYIELDQQIQLIKKIDEVSRLLAGFIKKLSARDS
jgi:four helix bundle protein